MSPLDLPHNIALSLSNSKQLTDLSSSTDLVHFYELISHTLTVLSELFIIIIIKIMLIDLIQ